jgi:hypothetical protein
MNYEKYEDITATKDFLEYNFLSVGPKGNIPKIVQFKPTANTEIYNLAFGNKNVDGSLDDITKDDNKDRNKILATVVLSIKLFTAEYPTKWVFFSGSTPERTRLYRMAVTLNLYELSIDYQIYGVLQDMENGLVNVPFLKGVDYFGFLIKRKNTNFTE